MLDVSVEELHGELLLETVCRHIVQPAMCSGTAMTGYTEYFVAQRQQDDLFALQLLSPGWPLAGAILIPGTTGTVVLHRGRETQVSGEPRLAIPVALYRAALRVVSAGEWEPPLGLERLPSPELPELLTAAERLAALLRSPEPGLATWHILCHECVQAVLQLWYRGT